MSSVAQSLLTRDVLGCCVLHKRVVCDNEFATITFSAATFAILTFVLVIFAIMTSAIGVNYSILFCEISLYLFFNGI